MDVHSLGKALCAFVMNMSGITDCNIAVFDCHGGPDNTSFAACINAHHTIIVSEPDRVTLYGTLNFIRRLQEMNLERAAQPHLVFNKVIPDFIARFLIRFYNEYLKENFNDNPLLAVYPLEVDLTKEFEKTPFLTSVYPTSQLAEKTRFLLYDLLVAKNRHLLPPAIANLGYLNRMFHEYYMGGCRKYLISI
jgi:MinD-like ATPase involved in chromosome partitioning or flagellar assembly